MEPISVTAEVSNELTSRLVKALLPLNMLAILVTAEVLKELKSRLVNDLILNFVTSTILGNPPILSHFSYSILKMTRNKKNSSSSILRMGRNSIAYLQNQY